MDREKCVKALAAFKYSITNDDWETTIEVDRNDLEDDQTGQYALKAKSAGRAAADLPDDIVFALVNEPLNPPALMVSISSIPTTHRLAVRYPTRAPRHSPAPV
ncbi:Mu-like prophage major head subunit gpT [Edwardsiella tarda]|nr:Mu-like prophage major head subunit gpT [Edwardsiella tarda]